MFSKTCRYAIRAVLFLAVYASPDNKLGATALAEGLEIPTPFLAKVLQQLSKANLVLSTKGPKGGFYLTEENLNATLIQIVESIDGAEVFTSCLLGLSVCSSENPCPLHMQAFAFREGFMYQLKHVSIRELANKIDRQNLKI